jgi:RNA polymerase sigma-70 factor (ECF subfamily)
MLDNEENIIKKAASGNKDAFGLLYDKYLPQIYRFIYIKVNDKKTAEDLTHQVFLNAWQNIVNYKHRGHPFSAWLYSIARNEIIDYYRGRKVYVSLDGLDPDSKQIDSNAITQDVENKLAIEMVINKINFLKPDYQDVIILRFVEEMSIKETALTIKKTEGAVKLIEHRALKQLRALLNEQI